MIKQVSLHHISTHIILKTNKVIVIIVSNKSPQLSDTPGNPAAVPSKPSGASGISTAAGLPETCAVSESSQMEGSAKWFGSYSGVDWTP